MAEQSLLAGQTRYQLLLLTRTPRALFAGLVFPLVLLVLRSGRHPDAGAESALVAGLTVLGVVSTAYLTHATGLVMARQDGVLRRWRATPLPRWCFFGGRIAATTLLAAATAMITIAAATLCYGLDLDAGTAGELLGVVVLGALAWAAVGTAITTFIPTAESAQPLLWLTFYPVVLLSGVFGSLGDEPRWLATVVDLLPVKPLVDAATRALRHSGFLTGREVVVLLVWATAGIVVSLVLFQWDPRRSQGSART